MKLSIYFVGTILLLVDSVIGQQPPLGPDGLVECSEISEREECKPKNGCKFNKDSNTCEVKPVKLPPPPPESRECADIQNKRQCKKPKFGCVFNTVTNACEDKPDCEVVCAADNDDLCCPTRCECSITNKKKCKKSSNCEFNKEDKVCGLLSAAGTGAVDKCNELNDNPTKCIDKKKCEFNADAGVCQTIPEDLCNAFNGQADDCNNPDSSCSYNDCTEVCSVNCGLLPADDCRTFKKVCKLKSSGVCVDKKKGKK